MERFFWVVLPPLALVLAGTALVLLALFGPSAHPPVDARLFLAGRVSRCAPEPLEQLGYLVALVIPAAVFGLGATAWPVVAHSWLGRWCSTDSRYPVCAVQWALVLFVATMLVAQTLAGHLILPLVPSPWPALLIAVGVLFVWRGPKTWVDRVRRFVAPDEFSGTALRAGSRFAPRILALAATVAFLLPGLYRDNSPDPIETVRWHLPFTMGEFAAVENGRTVDVDFYPQYQRLLAYLLLPVFQITGLTVTTFTTAMLILSAVGLLSLYDVFRRLTGNPWTALLLYLPLLWVAVLPAVAFPHRAHQVDGSFTYFAVGPIRYLGPFVTVFLLAVYLSRPSMMRLVALSTVASLSAINNLDFGLPALVGSTFAAWHTIDGRLFPRFRSTFWVASGVSLGVCGAVASYFILTFMRSGQFPNFTVVGQYQSAFAVHGFQMLPMPALGLHWVFYLTFLATLARGLFGPPETRLRNGLLLFAGVFGAGALMYYVGRSHWMVLAAVSPAWAFAFLLLAWSCWEDRSQCVSPLEFLGKLGPIPVLIAFGYWLCLSAAVQAPNPLHQVARLRAAPSADEWIAPAALCDFVRSHAIPGEKVAVLHADGHLIATRAGVINAFPFTHPGSLILRAQLELAMDQLQKEGVQRVFGTPEPEVAEELRRLGFERVGGLPDFELWERQLSKPQPDLLTAERS